MNVKQITTALVLAAGVSTAALAEGPMNSNPNQQGLAPFSGQLAGGGQTDYGFMPLSSTAAGDAMRGAAAGIRAVGEAVRYGSEAAVNIESAKKLYIDNNYDAAQAYWEKRRLWAENSAYLRGNALSQEQLRQLAREAAPSRLSILQLSPVTGEVNWPAALLRPEFEGLREKVEDVLTERTVTNSGVGSTTEVAVTRLTNAMQDGLKTQIDEMSPTEYISAKNFLRSLAYETRFIPGVEGVARR